MRPPAAGRARPLGRPRAVPSAGAGMDNQALTTESLVACGGVLGMAAILPDRRASGCGRLPAAVIHFC